jgi:hypothetical protein
MSNLFNFLKLRRTDSPYQGDVNVNSVLSAKDVDGNFIHLKGRDIVDVSYDNSILKLTKQDGNEYDVTIDIPTDINELSDDSGLLFDGDYNSLSNQPNIPSNLVDLDDIITVGSTSGMYLRSTGLGNFQFDNIGGNNYFTVSTLSDSNTNNQAVNGQRLFDLVEIAKLYNPPTNNTNPASWVKSANNRVVIVVPPGTYILPSTIQLNVQFIDIISLTGEADVFLTLSTFDPVINVSSPANDNRIIGIKSDRGVSVASNLTNLYVKNCDLGGQSFNALNLRGTYENVIVRASGSFASESTAMSINGTFINCEVRQGAGFGSGFGRSGVSGTFINCKAGDNSFGGGGNEVAISNVTFKDCVAGNNSFGSGNIVTFSINTVIQFNNCKAGTNSFGYSQNPIDSFTDIVFGGEFIDCVAGNNSFGHRATGGNLAANLTILGTFKNCASGTNSFGHIRTNQQTNMFFAGKFENCKAGEYSFGSAFTSGASSSITIGQSGLETYFLNCTSGRRSFGYSHLNAITSVIIQGGTRFENCVSGVDSFGSAQTSSVTTNITITQSFFYNCKTFGSGVPIPPPGNNSFGFSGGNVNLLFTLFKDCNAGTNSFGHGNGVEINGSTFENCKSGNNSFGVMKNPNVGSDLRFSFSNFINCESGNESFGYTEFGGTITSTLNITKFENCKSGILSFNTGNSGTSLVIFKDCVGGDSSFYGEGTLSGTFEGCVGGLSSFGFFETVSGTFTNCVGGLNSFGVNGAITGKLYRCQLTSGTFETPTGTGKIVLGIDGNHDIINLTA